KIRRSAPQLRHVRAESVQGLLKPWPSCERAGRLRGLRQVLRALSLPGVRQLAAHATLEFRRKLGKLRPVLLETCPPLVFRFLPSLASVPAAANVLGDHERRVLPTEVLTSRGHLFYAGRGAKIGRVHV